MMELKISLFSWINWTNQGTCWIVSFKSMPWVGYKKYQRTRVTIRAIEAESGRDEENRREDEYGHGTLLVCTEMS